MDTSLKELPLVTPEGGEVAFGTLWTGSLRVLVFVRHFG